MFNNNRAGLRFVKSLPLRKLPHNQHMSKLLLSIIFAFALFLTHSQNTNISGVINSYQSVSNVGANSITVGSTAGFSPGDMILLIQMQGVTIDETNTASFGDVVNLNSSGHYEFLTVCDVPNGTDLSVSDVQRTYDPAGIVQVVRVPIYDDATVTATLTADPWNGSTGGILAFKCDGDLMMNDNIDMQGLGFSGAVINTSSYTCQWFANVTDYHTDISTGYGAYKGEGNALFIANKEAGRGAQSNGGGGGNDHNSGGGGGGNGGTGGSGGERIASGTFTCSGQNPGIGGNAQTYNNTENRIFLGGGGGAGHENNPNTATNGNNGGGIVIIMANRIIANGNSILANGASSSTAEDGAGGGGAGGTVLLDAGSYTTTLNVDISGGNGGDVANVGASNCNGPGGGGGGGVLWTSQSITPTEITLISNGGASGLTTSATQGNCTVGSSNNATAGAAGIELNDLVIPSPVPAATGTDVLVACNSLTWIDGNTYTADTVGAVHTIVGGASNGCDSTVTLDLTVTTVDTSVTEEEFYLIVTGAYDSIQWFFNCSMPTPIAGETDDSLYTFTLSLTCPLFFAVIYYNGCSDTSATFVQEYESIAENPFSQSILLYPNPASNWIHIDLRDNYQNVTLEITDLSGRIIQSREFDELSEYEFQPELSKGSYLVIVRTESKIAVKRLVME